MGLDTTGIIAKVNNIGLSVSIDAEITIIKISATLT